MNFNYGFIKKEPKQPVMTESLKHVKIPQPINDVCHYDWDDKRVTMMKRIAAQIADTTDNVICQEIIDFAKKEGVTDLYLIDKEFIRDAIISKAARDAEVEALRLKINDLEEELQTVWLDLENAEERDNVKALTINELREELARAKNYIVDIAKGSNDLARQCDKQLKAKIDENDKLSKEIKELKKRNAYLEGVKLGAKHLEDKLYDDIHAIAEERDAVIEKNGTLAKRIGELEKERDGYIKRFKEYEDLYVKSDRLVEEFDKELEDMRAENQRLRDANACACEELDNKIKQNEELFKENKAFESMLSKAEQQRDFYMRRTSDYDRMTEKMLHLNKQIDKYDLVIHTIEQLFGCAFDI